ncbi:MAG: ATP-binding protein [Lachnospiraceae bacterium]|nr:ATP-binding protein [Lachnospiraceae bacterium]
MALTNSQYDQIMRTYEAKQRAARLRLEKKKASIDAAVPALRQLEEQIATFSVQQAHLLLEGDENALATLKDQLAKAHKKRISLLAQAGFTPEDLEPDYECPDCHDTGYIGGKRCHCLKQAIIDLIYTQSNIKAILETENFDTLTLDYYSDQSIDPSTGRSPLDNAKLAVNTCHTFVEQFDHTFENLFFYGSTGVGKTFLSNCVAKALMDEGHSVLYFTSFQLFNILEESKFHQSADAKQQAEDLFSCDLLIIDDLGTELTNSFSVSQLFLCLNERLLRKKSTIISSNLDLNKLFDTYSERNFSRIISNYKLLKLTGADIRLQKRTQ